MDLAVICRSFLELLGTGDVGMLCDSSRAAVRSGSCTPESKCTKVQTQSSHIVP